MLFSILIYLLNNNNYEDFEMVFIKTIKKYSLFKGVLFLLLLSSTLTTTARENQVDTSTTLSLNTINISLPLKIVS